MTDPKIIAFYLPQYHPNPDNDKWWGKGFTEWKVVAKAKPLFKGHYQPHYPADLGYYDLRVPEVRQQQAELAREAGIHAFCYYHYWFGNGKRLLERPFNEVVDSGSPDFPFCLCWANHSWMKKLWDPKAPQKDVMLQEQLYPGEEDYKNHFYALLKAFKDPRYVKVENRLLFFIYDTQGFSDIKNFIQIWRKLAKDEGLNDFYFVGTDYDGRFYDDIMAKGLDAVYENDGINIHHHLPFWKKGWLHISREYLKRPTIFSYKKAIDFMLPEICKRPNVFPTLVPNWDHSPRSGGRAMILHNSTPRLFNILAQRAINLIKHKPEALQIIMLKSWNEWGEGNYMEPDEKFGHGYIKALKEALENKD